MRRSILLGGFALAAGIMPAGAADIPFKGPALPSWTNEWTGFYLGASVGAGTGFAVDGTNIRSWLGGFQLGYNYQINWLVVGVEGNFDWAGFRNKFACSASVCFAEPEWFATTVGRIGGVFGSALFYVDGGAAWTHDTVTDVFAGDAFLGGQIRPGWTVGAGVAYQLSHNWSVKVEYDYLNFGGRSLTLADDLGASTSQDLKQTVQLVKAGFNYRFNGASLAGSGPVMSYASAENPSREDDDSAKTIRALPSLTVGKDAVDGLVAGLFALTGDLEHSGPRLYLSGGAGWYQFGTTTGTVRGVYSTGALLGGLGFVRDNLEVNVLAGPSVENDLLSAFDPTDPVHGTAAGLMVRGEASANPTAKTYIEAEAEFTTAFDAYYSAAKFGYDALGKGFFIGPQVAAIGDQRFHELRIGVAISQLKFGNLEFDLAGGYSNDSSVGVGKGAFGEIGCTIEF